MANGNGYENPIENQAENENKHESVSKRLKTHNYHEPQNQIIAIDDNKQPEKCLICKQYSDQLILYNGHPNASVEEYVALTNESLLLFTGEEVEVDQHDERPTNKITSFNIYDKNGHLVAIDSGLIEQDVLLYVSGYIKPIFDEDPSAENGISAHDIGPINAWYISGYDGGEKAIVFFTTAYADYYMMAPSEGYEPLTKILNEKIKLAKIVVEFLVEESCMAPAYEDLLQRLASYEDPAINEECLIRHAQFICDQILSVEDHLQDDDDYPLFIALPCIRNLVKIGGVSFEQQKYMGKMVNNISRGQTAQKWSKATTTTLVRQVMESYFTDQIASHREGNDWEPRKTRCGVCDACQQPDCGNCSHCRAMLKFGGSGRSKQACKMRSCPNMAVQSADDSDGDEENEVNEINVSVPPDSVDVPCSKRIVHEVEWLGEPSTKQNARIYYNKAKIGNSMISSGDYVVLNPSKLGHPLMVAQVIYMWEDLTRGPMFHSQMYIRGSDTILGETSDPREIFYSESECDNCPVGAIVRRARVEKRLPCDNWSLNGGLDILPPRLDDDGETFFFSKRYDSESARFDYLEATHLEATAADSIPPCSACKYKLEKNKFNVPLHDEKSVAYQGEVYKVGSAVYLTPEVFKTIEIQASDLEIDKMSIKSKVDNVLYPEYYRKSGEIVPDAPEPFCLGLIQDMWEVVSFGKQADVKIQVKRFYRPENTHKGKMGTQFSDLNLLYFSDEDKVVDCTDIQGKCFIVYGYNLEDWSKMGPNRFYFLEKYNSRTLEFEEVPAWAMRIGLSGKGTDKLPNKSKIASKSIDVAPIWEKVEPLRCLDVFAGCGGLSEGLHQSGVANTLWAIEKEKAAAHAFQLNNPHTKVFTDDCNKLLKDVMDGKGRKIGMPSKGDVELLVGGPPCQGFSRMNRYNAGQYSLLKNSLIVSYLSYCDYYRPKYFILENVRNFVTFKKSLVLKLTIRCLLQMGYQATFGIVQAGHYGVPQTRRRLIILAAGPGYQLPKFPEPLHVFSRRGSHLSVQVGDHRYTNGTKWADSAPLRAITVRDAMSDLPPIKNGASLRSIPYSKETITHYQRQMRGSAHNHTITDHICKVMAPLVEARMSHVPLAAGSDWRDLPNIVVRLKDGTFTNKLRYDYKTRKQKSNEEPKGVCQCAMKDRSCDPTDRQFNTLIPWCLPHTADRHNNWSGLYGRLEWDGYFNTTVTNPEPMGKQGKVLHPEQHRVVSVRECARSQGFPDWYQFAGGILDKHRQVGNAVPPPLGAALGREILKAQCSKK